MTVGVRRALVRLVLLGGGVVILLMLWDARAAGAQETPLIEPVVSELPPTIPPTATLLDLGAGAVDDLAPATVPMVGDGLAPAAPPTTSGSAERVDPIPGPAPAAANRGAPAPARPSAELVAAPPAPAPSPPAPAREKAPTDGPGDSDPTRTSEPRPRPTPALAALALALAWAVVPGARPREAAAWRPGITPLRPLSRPG